MDCGRQKKMFSNSRSLRPLKYFSMMDRLLGNATKLVVTVILLSVWQIQLTLTLDLHNLKRKLIWPVWIFAEFKILELLSLLRKMIMFFLNSFLVVIWIFFLLLLFFELVLLFLMIFFVGRDEKISCNLRKLD